MTNKIKYIGKALLIEEKNEKILVIGDLHLGYEEALNKGGVFVTRKMFEEITSDFDKIFRIVGKVDKIVLLGDLKHNFSGVLKQEWEDVLKLFDYLHEYCREIIITKGNHDNYLKNIAEKRDFVLVVNYFIFGKYCFMHGNKKSERFDEVERDNGKKIKTLIVGHMHPAIRLSEGVKKETYKCFLTGKFKKWKFIIVPSFFEYSQGTDVRNRDINLAFPIDISKFEVGVVGENLKVLNFGKLKKIDRIINV